MSTPPDPVRVARGLLAYCQGDDVRIPAPLLAALVEMAGGDGGATEAHSLAPQPNGAGEWCVSALACRYGVSLSTMRARVASGEFGAAGAPGGPSKPNGRDWMIPDAAVRAADARRRGEVGTQSGGTEPRPGQRRAGRQVLTLGDWRKASGE